MSETTEKPKPTKEDLAMNTGLKIFQSGRNVGLAEGRKESKDPDAKRLGFLVAGAVKLKAKGKTSTPKQLQNLAINIKDENDYSAIEQLCRKSLLMLANATKPVKEKKIPQPPPTTS